MKYTGDYLREISFPLGGIGTGSIGLDGSGRLVDWEIFNRPDKGSINGYSHFAIRAIDGDKIIPAVLNGDILKEYMGRYSKKNFMGYGFGYFPELMCGFPHFQNVEFDGEFPFAKISFNDEKFPGDVVMTAFNPFIPRDAKNSSIPAAFFEIEVENTTDRDIKYQIALTLSNPYEKSVNKGTVNNNCSMLNLYNNGVDKDSVGYGDITAATDCPKAYTQTYWYRGEWQDKIVSFWNDFSGDEILRDRKYDTEGSYDRGTLAAEIEVGANEKKKVRFVISWNSPNCYNYWDEYKDEEGKDITWKNYYATVFEDSSESALYALSNWDDLYERTLKFKEALYGTTLPETMIEAAAANLSVLKSPTVLRLEDGSFYGWEGVHEQAGSCEGTCQHVWNYQYALCFLFPELERSIRDNEFKYSTDKDGRMQFRMTLPAGREMHDWRACLDGQMGAVIKCYREWKIFGDSKWLENKWDNIERVLEYAWSDANIDCWDKDKDGVLEGRQHHTLDKELFGPSSWLQGFYLAALKAAAEMAEYLGKKDKAQEYLDLFEKGYNWTKENLFNGRYFFHKVDVNDKSIVERYDAESYWNDEVKQIKYQVAEGSIIDQMLGQWHADILGLGDIFDRGQVDTALSNMMKINYKPSMRYVVNTWRIYSLQDEAGTIICYYPDDVERPKIPITYSDETMTGFEYSFAGLLCSNGRVDDGLKVVKAIRDRFDGKKRNPWNEYECGSNYARSMASYALIPILSGFEFDMPNKHIGFNPYIKEKFRSIWSLDAAWGEFKIDAGKVTVSVSEGQLPIKSLGLKFVKEIKSLKIDGKKAEFELKDGVVVFEETVVSDKLEIEI